MSGAAPLRIDMAYGGRRAVITRGTGHPEQYLYIECDGRTFFLGVLEKGMTRRDVKRMARAWMERHAAGSTIPHLVR